MTSTANGEDLRTALLEAAEDLSIELRLDECFLVSPSGARFEYTARLPQFGSPQGIVIFDRSQYTPESGDLAHDQVGAFSTLGPQHARYHREVFVDMLEDWGWFGLGPAPDWYRRRSHP